MQMTGWVATFCASPAIILVVSSAGAQWSEPGDFAQTLPAPVASDCDPHYAGHCVPIDSDVDCAGGKGNGPSFVPGPFRYEGSDPYGLDRDGDGIACE